MKKILTLLVALTVLAVPVIACIDCEPDMQVATVDTYFYNDGPIAGFHSGLWMNDASEGIIEEIYAFGPAELTVVENKDFGYDFCPDLKTVNADKLILWEPDSLGSSVSIAKDVWWGWGDGIGGEVYREAYDTMVLDTVHAGGIGSGTFMDRIEVDVGAHDLTVYQSVGLNQFATCDQPVAPPELRAPVCTWCD